jgi:hypothetical protein
MLNHSVEICKRRDAFSFKTSEGVSALPLFGRSLPGEGSGSDESSVRKTTEFVRDSGKATH